MVSTHSRAEAAAILDGNKEKVRVVSTHSRAEAAAAEVPQTLISQALFQHTAARRRLLPT